MKYRFAVLAIMAVLASCKPAENGGDEGSECNCDKPAVVINGVTESSAEVNIDLKGLDDAYYMCVPKSQGTPSQSEIEEDGVRLEESLFTLSGLDPETDYLFVLSARCGHDNQQLAYAEFTTLEDTAVEVADGFMAYDGLDSASGRYRLNIMMSTKSMSGDAQEYDDILVYVYLKYELERIDANTRTVPFGKITPFYTDGTAEGDMLYYIGERFTDSDGTPNASGTSIFRYKDGKVVDVLVADDTEKSSFEIVDNGDGSYTVKGCIADKTKGESYSFRYVDDKAVFSLDQTGM